MDFKILSNYPNTRKLIEEKHSFEFDQKNQTALIDIEEDLVENQKFLPNEVNSIRNEGKDLLLRLLEYDPKKRIKSIISLQKISMYKNFKIDLKSLLKISPFDIIKIHKIVVNQQNEEDLKLELSNIFHEL